MLRVVWFIATCWVVERVLSGASLLLLILPPLVLLLVIHQTKRGRNGFNKGR